MDTVSFSFLIRWHQSKSSLVFREYAICHFVDIWLWDYGFRMRSVDLPRGVRTVEPGRSGATELRKFGVVDGSFCDQGGRGESVLTCTRRVDWPLVCQTCSGLARYAIQTRPFWSVPAHICCNRWSSGGCIVSFCPLSMHPSLFRPTMHCLCRYASKERLESQLIVRFEGSRRRRALASLIMVSLVMLFFIVYSSTLYIKRPPFSSMMRLFCIFVSLELLC